MLNPYILAVAIAVDAPQRLECRYFMSGFDIPEVAGMPYFVNRGKEFPEFGAEHPVGIGYETYIHRVR